MPRSRIVFLLILGCAILAVVVIRFVLPALPLSPTATPRPPLLVEVAVNTLAADWITEQAKLFNAQQVQIEGQTAQVRITPRDGVGIWHTGSVWTALKHPVAWIPEAAFTLDYATEAGLHYEIVTPSLASTSLVWGVFTNRADTLQTLSKTLDWEVIQRAASKESWQALGGSADWGYVKPAFASPKQSTSGLGALIVAAAAYYKTNLLTAEQLGGADFQRWLAPVIDAVPSFVSLGQQPASAMASRGSSAADFALLPESEWLLYYDRITNQQPLRLIYPAYKLVFDMPLAVWSGPETLSAERATAQRFADFLLQDSAQRQSLTHGLRPARLTLTSANAADFVSAGLVLDTPPGAVITLSSRSGAQNVLAWFEGHRRAP
jgi:hypothetical protein